VEDFVFHNPVKIIFGKKTLGRIGRELSQGGISRVLLLAGSGSIKANGVHASVAASLEKHTISSREVWGVVPNPRMDKAYEAIEAARSFDAQAVLAIGGGSVLDSAKCVAAGVYMDEVWDAYAEGVFINEALPVYTVLTLSGTGSEMNGNSVMTKDGKKWATGSPALYPKVSIIDPRVQYSLPRQQTVNGAVDAISHIMEYYFLGTTQETTLAVNEALIKTVIKSVDILQDDPEHYAARADLAWSATLALNGLSGVGLMGGDWSAHFIEHGVSAVRPDVAHGAGLAVLFPAWLEALGDHLPADILERFGRNVFGLPGSEAVAALREVYRRWGAPTTLADLQITAEEAQAACEHTLEFVALMEKKGHKGGKLMPLAEDFLHDVLRRAA
jgi:hypothetical protein